LSLESDPSTAVCTIEERRVCPSLRRRALVSAVGALAVTGMLGVVLVGRAGRFVGALNSVPVSILALAVLLQIVALLARTEAWNICVHAAGATVTRRPLFRAAGVGCLASVLNGSVGMATRIIALRRAAPGAVPGVPALLAAEVPIITVEVALAAIFSFTMIAPLGVAWWVPVIAVVIMGAAVAALGRVVDRRRTGLWTGLAVMRSRGRIRMVACVLVAVCAQVARNWLILRAVGVHISVFDAMALLIAMFTVGQLPIGPSMGPAAAVLILGSHGVAVAAAAGVLLTATGTVAGLSYAGWAIVDRIVGRAVPRTVAPSAAAVTPAAAVTAVS
jgi:hypothetical protein